MDPNFKNPLTFYFLLFFYALIFVLFVLALVEYRGQGYVYVLFSLVSTALLYSGFRKNALFFDTFIGIFLWLGFWLKLTIRVAFMNGQFHEPIGNFGGSGAEFDQALLVASCGFLGFLSASYLRERYFFTYQRNPPGKLFGLNGFYQNHRKVILFGFVIFFVVIAATNLYFGIYQRGQVPKISLPYWLSGIYIWLLLFGLASITSMILHLEFTTKRRTTYLVAVIGLLEAFLTNVSLLSRGMILNASALAYGVFKSLEFDRIKTNVRFWVVTSFVFIVLFACSIVIANHLRSGNVLESSNFRNLYGSLSSNSYMTTPLFIDRWVGIEGVMAVSSYPAQGWKLWNDAWKESHSTEMTSFYDTNIITSPYKNMDMTKHNYVSLPGILAFCFYPGSFLFLFCCMFILAWVAVVIEIFTFKLGGGNIILCALLSQVVAYRYAHFGYVPSQSYLLFGALFFNLLIIYFSNRFLLYWNSRPAGRAYQNP